MKRIIVLALSLILLTLLVFPIPAMAKTRWDLEGWRVDATKWMDGLLFTWYEDDLVPYRLEATGYDGVDTEISIQHDYLDASGHYGVDYAQNFFIAETTGRATTPESITAVYTPGSVFTVTGPNPVEVPNGYIQEWVFTITDPDELETFNGGDWAIYWEAHLALTGSSGIDFGSSYWNGASLHAHTSVTGNQDVPIKTPPVTGPPASPSIDVEKLVKADYCGGWYDADFEPGPVNTGGSGVLISFWFIVENTGDVELTDIELTDSDPAIQAMLDLESIPTSLLSGETFEVFIYDIPAEQEHFNRATVTGYYDGEPYQDYDDVYYTSSY